MKKFLNVVAMVCVLNLPASVSAESTLETFKNSVTQKWNDFDASKYFKTPETPEFAKPYIKDMSAAWKNFTGSEAWQNFAKSKPVTQFLGYLPSSTRDRIALGIAIVVVAETLNFAYVHYAYNKELKGKKGYY